MKKTSVTTPTSGEPARPAIVFFGSGPVAARSLELLHDSFAIEAVVTKPRPTHHKGSVPVLEVAEQLDLTVRTVTNRQTLDDLITSKPFTSRLAVLIDFGIIVSQAVIDYFPLGIVNSHFSLLPQWRGADPITFAILSGQDMTGISLMLLVAAMDEGPLLCQAPYTIPPHTTTPQLTDTLVELSASTIKTILPMYIAGQVTPGPQRSVTIVDGAVPTYSRKLTKQDAVLDFHKPAGTLEREIRAFAEWPRSKARFGDTEVIITAAHATIQNGAADVGHLTIDTGMATLQIACGEGTLWIDRLQPAGKKEMTVREFIAGYGPRLGDTARSIDKRA